MIFNHIVFLSTYYSGIPSANGICAKNLVNQLKNKGYIVDVVCYEDNCKKKEEHGIYKIDKYKQNKGCFLKNIEKIVRLIQGDATTLMSEELINSYYDKLKMINKNNPIDVVIAMFFSIESVEAMYRFKKENPSILTISYELDSIGDGIAQEKSIKQLLITNAYDRWLHKKYMMIDKIIIMKSHFEYWKSKYNIYLDKIAVADIPVLIDQSKKIKLYKKYSLLYSGIIEKEYRSPKYLLRVLLELKNRLDFDFLFFSKGNCEDDIAEASRQYSGIKQKGFISPKELNIIIAHSGFLISIGNSVSNSLPSKLISYISSGKPIIHFSSQKNDICKEYLSRYPLSLIIDQDLSYSRACDLIYSFIKHNQGKNVKFEDIKEKFYLNSPEYSAKLICSIITTAREKRG